MTESLKVPFIARSGSKEDVIIDEWSDRYSLFTLKIVERSHEAQNMGGFWKPAKAGHGYFSHGASRKELDLVVALILAQ